MYDYKKTAATRYRKARQGVLLEKYGLTVEQFNSKKQEQDNRCAICLGIDPNRELAVDHNHETGDIRGLLCTRCNLALGYVREDKRTLVKMIEYLDYWNQKYVSRSLLKE